MSTNRPDSPLVSENANSNMEKIGLCNQACFVHGSTAACSVYTTPGDDITATIPDASIFSSQILKIQKEALCRDVNLCIKSAFDALVASSNKFTKMGVSISCDYATAAQAVAFFKSKGYNAAIKCLSKEIQSYAAKVSLRVWEDE